MGRKIIEIPQENEGFQRSLGVMHGATSQKISLSCPSVWGRKSLNILRKIKDLWVQGADDQRGFAENELKLPLSMGRKIIEIP